MVKNSFNKKKKQQQQHLIELNPIGCDFDWMILLVIEFQVEFFIHVVVGAMYFINLNSRFH